MCIQPLHLKMHRATRIKRAPNREPTSLVATITPSLHENEAIDVVKTPISEANIDLVLITLGDYDIDPPPPPPAQLLDCLDPNDDTYLSIDFEYPLPSLLESQQNRAISWSPTPPPTSRPQVAIQTPPPLIIDDIQPQLALRWTFEMEETLFFALIEQVDLGKCADSGFKKEAWIACCNAIEKATGQLVTIEKCKGKVDTMKALWRELNWLKDQSGFGWDEDARLVKARDQAWKDVIKVISDTIDNIDF
jgi:hypothetical protein